jgi:hypothetical protein
MSFNHKDVVVMFSKIVATIINYIIILVFIIVAIIVLYTFYTFVFDPYKGGGDPAKIKRGLEKPTTTYMIDYNQNILKV